MYAINSNSSSVQPELIISTSKSKTTKTILFLGLWHLKSSYSVPFSPLDPTPVPVLYMLVCCPAPSRIVPSFPVQLHVRLFLTTLVLSRPVFSYLVLSYFVVFCPLLSFVLTYPQKGMQSDGCCFIIFYTPARAVYVLSARAYYICFSLPWIFLLSAEFIVLWHLRATRMDNARFKYHIICKSPS